MENFKNKEEKKLKLIFRQSIVIYMDNNVSQYHHLA